MTLAEAGEIFAYWEQNPPVHLMVQTIARLLGWMPRPAPAGMPGIAELAAAVPPGLAVAPGGDLGMPAALSLDALRVRNQARTIAIARRNRSAAGG